MRAAVLHAPDDVRVEERPDPTIAAPPSGKVFDLTLPLERIAEGYRAMDERRAVKALVRP